MFSDVDPNQNEKNAQAGVKAHNEGGHDGVVAFGGGSGLMLLRIALALGILFRAPSDGLRRAFTPHQWRMECGLQVRW